MPVKTVMVLFGGVSTEHLISRRSAYNVICALERAGIDVRPVGITTEGDWLAFRGSYEDILDGSWQEKAYSQLMQEQPESRNLSVRSWLAGIAGSEPDCIFPAVHGINCEDGALQGLLQLSGFPYVGCHVLASAAGMDKRHSKLVFEHAGIPQCRYLTVDRRQISDEPDFLRQLVSDKIGFPCFLKPNQGGSSVGTKRVDSAAELTAALQEVAEYDPIVLIEEFVKAREIEVSVMGNEHPVAAQIGEIATSNNVAYYDYEAKYFSEDGAAVLMPAPLEPKQAEKVREYALRAYKALDCKGLARVDFFLTADDQLLINEINTLPGFTPISIFPKAFAASGISIEKLVVDLCELAVEASGQSRRKELI